MQHVNAIGITFAACAVLVAAGVLCAVAVGTRGVAFSARKSGFQAASVLSFIGALIMGGLGALAL